MVQDKLSERLIRIPTKMEEIRVTENKHQELKLKTELEMTNRTEVKRAAGRVSWGGQVLGLTMLG